MYLLFFTSGPEVTTFGLCSVRIANAQWITNPSPFSISFVPQAAPESALLAGRKQRVETAYLSQRWGVGLGWERDASYVVPFAVLYCWRARSKNTRAWRVT
jgi:hypothetical protein